MPLDPEVRAHLEREAAAGLPPRGARTLAEQREILLRAAPLAGPPPALHGVEDFAVAGIPVRLYTPRDAGSLPALLYLHGGRFVSGGIATHDPICRVLAAATDCRVAAVDYRLAPEHPFPAALEDCAAVLEWLAARGGPVAVMGDSAGGNLAAALALRARGAVAVQVLIYPMLDPTCSRPSHVLFATGYGPESADMRRGWEAYLGPRDHRAASPWFAGDLAGSPPAFVLTAEYDTLRDAGEEYARRLRAAGVDVTLRRFDGAIHGFFLMPGVLRLAREAIAETAAWLQIRWRRPCGPSR